MAAGRNTPVPPPWRKEHDQDALSPEAPVTLADLHLPGDCAELMERSVEGLAPLDRPASIISYIRFADRFV
jgi:hypothetical protein